MTTNTQPLFSVLVASYNNGRYLEECINSIQTQTYENWDIIIVDDASADNSQTIYKQYLSDPKIKVFFNGENKGCGYTKRACVAHASGDICGFVDPDDALIPNALSVMVENHIAFPNISIAYSTHFICDELLQPISIADYVAQIPVGIKSATLKRPVISHFATFKKQNYQSTDGISPVIPKAVDKDLYFKLEETGSVLFINKPLYYYRHHSENISLQRHSNMAYQFELTIRLNVFLKQTNKHLRSTMQFTTQELVYASLVVFLANIKIRKYRTALLYFANSLKFAPIKTLRTLIGITRRKSWS